MLGLALCGEKKIPFAFFKKLRKKARTFTGSGATRLLLQTCPLTSTRRHTAARSAQRGGAGHFNPGDAAQHRLPNRWPRAPSLVINRRHAIQPDNTVQLKMPLTKRQCLENSFVHNYELCVSAQTWPFSHRGNGICTLRFLSWSSSPQTH